MSKLKVLDLFSGIGGFSLGLERTGFETVAFCENAPFPRRVLELRWPNVKIYDDVRTLNGQRLIEDGIGFPDIIAGGFPCQDISSAGHKRGIHGARSGLWFEYLRIIEETKPQFVVAENVAALRTRGLDTVLRGLDALGYDAEWHHIPAYAVGSPQQRDRIWIISYPKVFTRVGGSLAESRNDYQGWWSQESSGGFYCDDSAIRPPILSKLDQEYSWPSEPGIPRISYGLPNFMDRLKCLGNASVPQISQLIGEAILNSIQMMSSR